MLILQYIPDIAHRMCELNLTFPVQTRQRHLITIMTSYPWYMVILIAPLSRCGQNQPWYQTTWTMPLAYIGSIKAKICNFVPSWKQVCRLGIGYNYICFPRIAYSANNQPYWITSQIYFNGHNPHNLWEQCWNGPCHCVWVCHFHVFISCILP